MIEEILHEKKKQIEQRLEKLLKTEQGAHRTLYNAMNYSLLAGGKRIRPSLFLLVLDVFGKILLIIWTRPARSSASTPTH